MKSKTWTPKFRNNNDNGIAYWQNIQATTNKNTTHALQNATKRRTLTQIQNQPKTKQIRRQF